MTEMIETAPAWIRYLAGAYPTARITGETVMVLEDQLGDLSPEILGKAARRWVARSRFWPAPAELREVALGILYDEAPSQQRPEFTDEDLLAWEIERGTMRPLDAIAAEIEAAMDIFAQRWAEWRQTNGGSLSGSGGQAETDAGREMRPADGSGSHGPAARGGKL